MRCCSALHFRTWRIAIDTHILIVAIAARVRPRLYNGWDGCQRVEFCLFDAPYVQRLSAGDPATEAHFSTYFSRFLTLKLRARRLLPEMAEDIRQETLFRVLKTLRQGTVIYQPERFGGFVNAVCNNVLLEFLNKEGKHSPAPEGGAEPTDDRIDLDSSLITEQRKRAVAEILDGLKSKDREILRLVFFEEEERADVCKKLGVDSEYLRVLLHRAKCRFEQACLKKRGLMQLLGPLFCY